MKSSGLIFPGEKVNLLSFLTPWTRWVLGADKTPLIPRLSVLMLGLEAGTCFEQ